MIRFYLDTKKTKNVWLKDNQDIKTRFPDNSRLDIIHNNKLYSGTVLDDRIYAGPIKPGQKFLPKPTEEGVEYIDHQVWINVMNNSFRKLGVENLHK